MSWLEKLSRTYDAFFDNPAIPDSKDLLPLCHTTQQAQIEIAIDDNGEFLRARVIESKEEQKTLIPCTEESSGRSGSKPKNHPLCDKLQYVAGDFCEYGGEVTSGFAGSPSEPFNSFCSDLGTWCDSNHCHQMAQTIHKYVLRKRTVRDLVNFGILPVDEYGKVPKKWENKENAPVIFRVLLPDQSPMDAFVRFRVEIPGQMDSGTWESASLINKWSFYYASRRGKMGLCTVLGEDLALAEQHPAKLRHDGDKAKLISSNDTTGFTFKGRFLDSEQAVCVSFQATQKAHNALRWLIRRKQAYRNGEQVFVTWAVQGKEIPDPWSNSMDFLNGVSQEKSHSGPATDAGQSFAIRFGRRMAGYRARIDDSDCIIVLGLNSATPGRMAITLHRELSGSEFLNRIEQWHLSYSWFQTYGEKMQFIGAPAPKDIAIIAYGSKVTGKNGTLLLNSTIERLIPCIIDNNRVPADLVEMSVRRTSNRSAIEPWEFEKALGIACALFKGYHKERSYRMALEEDRRTRDYLYGRLLAVAEKIEAIALKIADERRETASARLMQRFSDRPFSTWRTIEAGLTPYKSRLNSKYPGLLSGYLELLDSILCSFDTDQFTNDSRLSGEYLIGYHCQRMWLSNHKRSKGIWVQKATEEDVSSDLDTEIDESISE